MKPGNWLVAGLLGVNLVLAAGLLYRTGGWNMPAARGQPNVLGGRYLVASASGKTGGAVYVFNEDTGVIGGWVTPAGQPGHPVFIVPRSVTQDLRRVVRHLH